MQPSSILATLMSRRSQLFNCYGRSNLECWLWVIWDIGYFALSNLGLVFLSGTNLYAFADLSSETAV